MKVLLMPVGFYQERLWKSILKSAANRIYFIIDSKEPFAKFERSVLSELKKRIIHSRLPDTEIYEVSGDMTNTEEIYKVYIGILGKESKLNLGAEFILDLTASSKQLTLIVSELWRAYGGFISIVPGQSKLKESVMKERLTNERDDPGASYIELRPVFTKPSDEETYVLSKYFERERTGKPYASVMEAIQDLLDKKKGEDILGKVKKKYLRIVREMVSKGLLTSNTIGRSKSVGLTELGRGIIEGIIQSRPDFQRMMSSSYTKYDSTGLLDRNLVLQEVTK
ncbi:MAG: hypothetical protein JRN20_01750 [Nitrososphaerota archaeon]|nr:hypothetical protein [Nitrososphaerota archaeon]